jgi:hypothetical protein
MGGGVMGLKEKKKIVCCVDDERLIPKVVKDLVNRRKDPNVYFFQLVMGSADLTVPPSDEPVDIIAMLDAGECESPPLSVIGLVETIKAIKVFGSDRLEVLFVCDLSLDNVQWPIDKYDAHDFDSKLASSAEKSKFHATVRPGIYVLYQITQNDFNYVLTSANAVSPDFTDLPIKQPLGKSSGKPEAVSSMVEKCYTREFGFNRTWYDLASDAEDKVLDELNEQLGNEPFMNDVRHNVEKIVELRNNIDTSMVQVCRRLLETLSVVDKDVEDAQLKLNKQDSMSWALGITKTIAILRRTEPKTYLFDLLDIVRRYEGHTVEINGEKVRTLDDLKPLIHSQLTYPLTSGLAKLSEFFTPTSDSEFFWHHRVRLTPSMEVATYHTERWLYEAIVSPHTSKNYPINLTKLQGEGFGNGSRAYRMMSELFVSSESVVKVVVVQRDYIEEISRLKGEGLFILVKRCGEDYDLHLVGRRKFKTKRPLTQL